MSDMVYEKFSFSSPFLAGYKCMKIPIIDKNGNAAWPEVFPVSKIEEMRQTVGARHFSSQMMLEFVPAERVRLDPGALHMYGDEFDARGCRLGDALITGACAYWDPSSGRRKSDGSVCVLVYRDDKTRRAFIHDVRYLIVADGETHPLARQCDMVVDFLIGHGMRRIAIETNGIGNALPEIMRDVASRRAVSISIMPISNSRNKEQRILDAIEPMLTTGRLYAHTRVATTPLFAEMMGWAPVGATGHDDGIDAVAGALSTMPVALRAASAAGMAYRANTNFNI